MNTPAQIAHYTDRTAETIAELHPDIQAPAWSLFNWGLDNGILLLIYDGYRTHQDQQELYEAYLAGGPLAVAPGLSWHEYRRAFDSVPVDNDVAQWDSPLWPSIDSAASSFGLYPGSNFGDTGHYEKNYGMSIQQWLSANPQESIGPVMLPDFVTESFPITPIVVTGALALATVLILAYG